MIYPSNVPARYVENDIARRRQLVGMTRVLRKDEDMPVEMYDETILSENNRVGWKIIPSTVTNEQLDKLEKKLGLQYPPIYRQFLQSYHFYDLWFFDFVRHPIRNWQHELLSFYEAYDGLIKIGLIPFANESRIDAGAICFDTRSRLESNDCPVVFWDYMAAAVSEEEINPMFSSGEAMFRGLNFMAEAPIDFLFHDEENEPDNLKLKQQLMAKFLALDPIGAGGARDYWTMDLKP